MKFNLKDHKALQAELQCLLLRVLHDEYLVKRYREGRLRETYFKRVYEEFDLDTCDRKEVFLIGMLAEYVFCTPKSHLTAQSFFEPPPIEDLFPGLGEP
jgi:hypothetical protein